MANETTQGNLVLEHLHALGVSLLSEWDALTYLYRHSASLGTAAQIAHYIGHDKGQIGEALHRLEALGFIQRSRICQGMRLYRFSPPPDPARRSRILQLMSLAQNREGRMLIVKHLKGPVLEPRRKRTRGLRLA